MVQICREEAVWSVVDGAHSIGHELDLDLTSADPDFWMTVSSSLFIISSYIILKYSCRTVANGFSQRKGALCSMFLYGTSDLKEIISISLS